MRAFVGRGKRSIALAGVVLLIAGGVAFAAIPSGDGVFTACRLNATGTIRLIDPSLPRSSLLSHCTSLETQISWNKGGLAGPTGEKGPTGDKGPNGDQGARGDKGDRGDNGPPGDQGPIGDKGPVGDKGPTGDKGPAGDKGPTGDAGDKGPTGDSGPTGQQGPQGPPGAPGNGTILTAAVNPGGSLKGGTAVASTRTATGDYTVSFSRDLSGCFSLVQIGTWLGGVAVSDVNAVVHIPGPGTHDVQVLINDRSDSPLTPNSSYSCIAERRAAALADGRSSVSRPAGPRAIHRSVEGAHPGHRLQAALASARRRAASRPGGSPNCRRYSRLNCDALS